MKRVAIAIGGVAILAIIFSSGVVSPIGIHSGVRREASPGDGATQPDAAMAKAAKSGERGLKRFFTPEQWSRISADPDAWKLSPLDCLPSAIPVFGDIPIVSRLFEADQSGPSLAEHGELFGWDETVKSRVRDEMFRCASSLAKIRGPSAAVSFPREGVVRLDYSTGHDEERAAVSLLKQRLGEILGSREAEKFELLTSVTTWTNEPVELSITPGSTPDFVTVSGFPGGITLQDAIPTDKDLSEVDWQHLVEQPGSLSVDAGR